MKCAYSFAAVFVMLMSWQTLAANLPPDLVDLYGQRKFAEALPLAQEVVAIDEKALGPNHLDFAKDLNLLGLLYHELRHYAEAEASYERSLAIREQQLWPDHPDVAQSLSNLGLLYIAEGRYVDAERLLKRALAIRVKAFKSDHPDIGLSLRNVGNVYAKEGRCSDARQLYKTSLQIFERHSVQIIPIFHSCSTSWPRATTNSTNMPKPSLC